MTPTEEQKRLAKHKNIEDRYKGASNEGMNPANTTVNDMRAQSH
jgi:hypothetical protein